MSRGGRQYIHGDVEYRGKETITGHREVTETVYDETEAENEARIKAWKAENPDKSEYNMSRSEGNPYWRKYHQESRGIQPFEEVRTFGPYATLGAARRSVGVGSGFRKEKLTERNGHPHLVVLEVEIGRVTWTPAADEE